MKKALKAAIGLLVVSLTFSSCELFLLGMPLEELASSGEGSVASPHYLNPGSNPSYVGYNGDGSYSYYYFTVPSGNDKVTITYSSTSGADLDCYLYYSSSFTSLISPNTTLGTSSTWFDEYAVTSERSYYLKVYNNTNIGTVNFTLTLAYASPGEGSVASPHSLSSGSNSSYVGCNGDGRYSYYTFTVPTESNAVTITYSSASSADLDFYLYSNSNFTTLVESNISSEISTLLFDNQAVTGGSSYYLRVYNHTNTATVNFTLNLSFAYLAPETSLNTISGSEYNSRANWTYGYLEAGETHWYQLNVNSTSSLVYIHWQDSYDYDVSYSQLSADIKVSVYAANKTTLLASIQDNGYSIDYWNVSSVNGIGVTDATRYWVKVEGYSTSSHGSYYLSAVEVPVN